MLTRSFIHFRGFGPAGESRLWARGFLSWDDLCERGGGDRLAARALHPALESRLQLGRRNAAYFHSRLPPRERWRMYEEFLGEAAFVDIETAGGYGKPDLITVIGVLDRSGYRSFVRGENLAAFPEAIASHRLLVTFNGAAFDIPIIEKHFGHSALEGKGHIDLRFPLARIGYSGGLKSIERQLGAGRPDDLSLLSGWDAVRLWRMHCDGEPDALTTLIRYNAEDVMSLPALAEIAVDRLAASAPLKSFDRPRFAEIDRAGMPFDSELVRYLTRGRTAASPGRL